MLTKVKEMALFKRSFYSFFAPPKNEPRKESASIKLEFKVNVWLNCRLESAIKSANMGPCLAKKRQTKLLPS
jgi:hypothetical protein